MPLKELFYFSVSLLTVIYITLHNLLSIQDYIFGEADYDLCMLHVKATMDRADDGDSSDPSISSLGTLRYLVYSCTYGGRMEDEFDIRTLETFLNRQVPCSL